MVDQMRRPAAEDVTEPVIPVAPAPYPTMWISGRLVPWEKALVHINMVTWPAITGIFEGIRGYWNADRGELNIFRLREHIERMQVSMKLRRMLPQYSTDQLIDTVLEVCRLNDVREDCYIQPYAFMPGGAWGSRSVADQVPEIVVHVRPNPSALLTGRTQTACVSSWTRITEDSVPPRIKAFPNYTNSRLASYEAASHGYNAAIFLNHYGKVAESTGSCIFLVRNGVVLTPPVTASILESITRDALLTLARDGLGVPTVERDIDRTELYIADEIFLCGTHEEVGPVVNVDGYQFGSGGIGPVTARLEQVFSDVVRGRDPRFAGWLTRV
jgi:branched-chain amino acid aminotransferase